MRYLLDTCVLSEFVRTNPEPAVQAWLSRQNEHMLFVSALSFAELERGVAKLAPSRRREALSQWLSQLKLSLAERTLPFTMETASYWGEMCAKAETQGKPMATFDSLIAACAVEHGLALVTRNEKDFASASLLLVNPWNSGT